MKYSVSLVLFALAALVCGQTFAQPKGAQSPPAAPASLGQDQSSEIALLRRDVSRLQAEVAQLKQGSGGDVAVDMKDVVAYLNAQAKSASVLQKVLADSEEKGFTFGINPESREVLLAGFHEFVNTLQADVPGAPKDDAQEQ